MKTLFKLLVFVILGVFTLSCSQDQANSSEKLSEKASIDNPQECFDYLADNYPSGTSCMICGDLETAITPGETRNYSGAFHSDETNGHNDDLSYYNDSLDIHYEWSIIDGDNFEISGPSDESNVAFSFDQGFQEGVIEFYASYNAEFTYDSAGATYTGHTLIECSERDTLHVSQ